MSEDSLICPFCGGPVLIKVTDACGNNRNDAYEFAEYQGQGLYFRLVHDETNVPEGKSCPIATFEYEAEGQGLGTILYESRGAAIKVWNTRIESPELPGWLKDRVSHEKYILNLLLDAGLTKHSREIVKAIIGRFDWILSLRKGDP